MLRPERRTCCPLQYNLYPFNVNWNDSTVHLATNAGRQLLRSRYLPRIWTHHSQCLVLARARAISLGVATQPEAAAPHVLRLAVKLPARSVFATMWHGPDTQQ